MADDGEKIATPDHRARRQWFKGTLGVVLIGAATYISWKRFLFAPAPPQPRTGTAIGKTSEFAAGSPPKFVGNAIVENLGNDQFRTLSARCTHQGCRVNWNAASKTFLCPCHGGAFDLSGKHIGGPPPSPLPTLSHYVQDGVLYVDVA